MAYSWLIRKLPLQTYRRQTQYKWGSFPGFWLRINCDFAFRESSHTLQVCERGITIRHSQSEWVSPCKSHHFLLAIRASQRTDKLMELIKLIVVSQFLQWVWNKFFQKPYTVYTNAMRRPSWSVPQRARSWSLTSPRKRFPSSAHILIQLWHGFDLHWVQQQVRVYQIG